MPSTQSRKGKGLNALLQELSDDKEDTVMDIGLLVPDDPEQPWLHDFCAYLDASVLEKVLEGWSAIQWWGVSISISTGIF